MSLFVVRHGRTALNAARVLQPADTPLDAIGHAQARHIAARLADQGIAQILSSDMPRALETAHAIAERTGARIDTEPLLRERDFGTLCGTPYADLPPDIFAPSFAPPGGETWEAFFARVTEAWQVVQRRVRGKTVIVTHGLVCHAWATRHWKLPAGRLAPVTFRNTSLSICEPAPPHAVQLLDCVAHLEQDPTGSAPA